MARRLRTRFEEPPAPRALIDHIQNSALPLQEPSDLSPLLKRVADAHYVLLGEASHGTAEYYTWRTRISQQLILEKGFNFIAVEGDWPDCYGINRYIKGRPNSGHSAREVISALFRRWPTWMWGNEEIIDLVEWLRQHNEGLPEERKVGFYGLDVYSLWDSLAVLSKHLARHDPLSLAALEEVIECFEPYGKNAQAYAQATADFSTSCAREIVYLLESLKQRQDLHFDGDGRENYLQAEQNAVVLQNAEAYYRSMVQRGPESWNIRDLHMTDTLDRLIEHHGPEAKAIVWEHNTHIGDARFTDMTESGEFNVGQLVRERHGADDSVLVGFSSYQGTVIAGNAWDAPMQIMPVPPARRGSWEDLLHRTKPTNKLLIFDESQKQGELLEKRGHRAIGVVYHPEYEHLGNYVPTVLSQRYDALLYIDKTAALHPLGLRPRKERDASDTYPFSL